jgi:hypothetical protein
MSSIVSINGQTFEVKNGKNYLNGTEIKNNCVDNFGISAVVFFAGFVVGFMFLISIFKYLPII